MTAKLSLNGRWQCKSFLGEDWLWRNSHCPGSRDCHGWLEARVPGSVFSDLLRAGELPDPHWDRNSRLCEWVPQRTWLYKREFEAEAGPATLVFQGVDYACTVFLNGQELGRHVGMYTAFEFAVSLQARNLLAVVIEPAPPEEPQVGRTSRVRTHKSRMSYGWDFCPRLVHLGIYRDVYLRFGPEPPRPRVELTPDRQLATVTCGQERWQIHRPRLWSPRDPFLYRDHGVRYGVRQVTWVANERAPQGALPYTLVLNGERTYLKGWNWVPVDALDFSRDPERLLRQARHAQVNLLRVWGGGLIESERFYELCDELGIMVWQEFALSSSGIESCPSDDPAYLDLLRREAPQLVERLAPHPSLIVWCGGNELQSSDGVPLAAHPALEILREAAESAGYRFLPSSPSGPTFLLEPGRDNHDVHGPWEHQGLQRHYELYNQARSLLHSEFGVEGMSRLETLQRTLPAQHLWPATRANPHYAHRGAWWINEPLLQECFGPIERLDELVRASQFLQAEGLRYALESNFRRRFQNSGSLPWQFNEPFPNAYCTSAVEYDGRPKPVYYAVRRVYLEPYTASFDSMLLDGDLSYTTDAPQAEVLEWGALVMLVLPDNRYLFVRGSNLQPLLRAPLTRVEQRGNRLVNCGAVPALNVWLESDDLLSDNYFHLLPGESRLIEGSWTKVSWWNSI